MPYLVGPKTFSVAHGGTKARADIAAICKANDFKELNAGGQGVPARVAMIVRWFSLAAFARRDLFVFNFPSTSTLSQAACRLFSLRHNIVFIVHDIDQARDVSPTQALSALNSASACIISGRLDELPQAAGRLKKVIRLECWDYLVADSDTPNLDRGNGVLFAGNLSITKSPWLYESSRMTPLHVAGIDYEAHLAPPIDTFLGSFDPDKPDFPAEVGWGLVWDGVSVDALAGPTGLYQRFNQPHKFSLYLAMGLPIICSDKAAVANLVREWKIGFTVSSINQIPLQLERLSDAEKAAMRSNALEYSRKVRAGYFLGEAVKQIDSKSF